MYHTCKGELLDDLDANSTTTDWAVFVFKKDESIREPKQGDAPYWAKTQKEALQFITEHIRDSTTEYQYVLKFMPTIHHIL